MGKVNRLKRCVYIHLHISKKIGTELGVFLTDHIYNTHLYNIKIIIFIYIKVYEEMFVDIIHSCLVERLYQLWACVMPKTVDHKL